MIWLVCAVAAATLIATAGRPAIDLDLARALWLSGWSSSARDFELARTVARTVPPLLCGGLLAMLPFRTATRRTKRAVAARRAAFLALTIALGPGLLVNGVLKEISHRPRPRQTIEVAGSGGAFRPFYAFDGVCVSNCSFSSGEAAGAFWTVAAALISPPPVRLTAVAAALTFGIAASAMRVAAGAHYLSDVAFSALTTLLIVLVGRRVFASRSPDALRERRRPPRNGRADPAVRRVESRAVEPRE